LHSWTGGSVISQESKLGFKNPILQGLVAKLAMRLIGGLEQNSQNKLETTAMHSLLDHRTPLGESFDELDIIIKKAVDTHSWRPLLGVIPLTSPKAVSFLRSSKSSIPALVGESIRVTMMMPWFCSLWPRQHPNVT
jgi:hypothetical protein